MNYDYTQQTQVADARNRCCRAVMRTLCATLIVIALVAPGTVWAQTASCTSDPKEMTIDQTWKKVSIGDSVQYQSRFEFDAIPDAVRYRLEVTEFSVNSIPATLGRVFTYDAENPPTSVDEFKLHAISSGSIGAIGVILFTGSAHRTNSAALEQLEGYYAAIRGKAVVTFECKTTVDLNVIATSALTGSRDNRIATLTATLENLGTATADGVELVVPLPNELYFVSASDSRCTDPRGPVVGGTITCRGLSIPGSNDPLGRNTVFIDIVTRVVNASALADREDRVVMTVTAPDDINNTNNEDSTALEPQFSGTLDDTVQAMEALTPYFNYLAAPGLRFSQCNVYRDDILGRFEALHAQNPAVFENLSYAPISSGTYDVAGINGLESSGHVGVVVYVKGSNYKQTGIVVHGTPSWSPVDLDLTSRRGALGVGEHVSGSFFVRQGTSFHNQYYRTPVSRFPGTATFEGKQGCGFEGGYSDNLGEFARIQQGCSTPAAAGSCPVMPDAVVVRTESPVEIQLTNSRAQRLETRGGRIPVQELGKDIFSYPTRHADGTYGWFMVLPKDNYDIKLVGTGQGSYKLTTVNFSANGDENATVYEGTTSNGQLNDYKIAAAPPQAAPAPTPAPSPAPAPAQSGSGGGGSTNPAVLLALFVTLLAGRRLRAAGRRAIVAG